MTDDQDQKKTPPNVAKAITKFKEKKERMPIGIDLYLSKEAELSAYEKWENLKSKKAFIMLCLENADEILEMFDKKK